MKYQLILCAAALMLGTVLPATADVNLNIPNDVELLTVNGKLSVNSSNLVLTDGTNQIAFRYTAQYRQRADSIHYLSDVQIIRFDASEQTLTLKLPAITSAQDAKRFDESPNLTLVDAQNKTLSFASDTLIKNGMQLGRDYENEILQYNLSAHPASLHITMNTITAQSNSAITPSSAIMPRAPAVTSAELIVPAVINDKVTVMHNGTQQESASGTPSQAEISKMLDYWYKLANDNTKANFKAKINQQ